MRNRTPVAAHWWSAARSTPAGLIGTVRSTWPLTLVGHFGEASDWTNVPDSALG